MREPDEQSNPASFYASPEEARQAKPEEFLYLACLDKAPGFARPTSSPWSTRRRRHRRGAQASDQDRIRVRGARAPAVAAISASPVDGRVAGEIPGSPWRAVLA
jgi:hypothetical protein